MSEYIKFIKPGIETRYSPCVAAFEILKLLYLHGLFVPYDKDVEINGNYAPLQPAMEVISVTGGRNREKVRAPRGENRRRLGQRNFFGGPNKFQLDLFYCVDQKFIQSRLVCPYLSKNFARLERTSFSGLC